MSKVWVREVTPNNLHNFKHSQLELRDLEPGLNLVFASNATGKSTLAKSILSLFQPDRLDEGATVNGVVVSGDESESLSRRKKDPAKSGFPGRSKDYYFDLPSLIEGLGKDSGVEQFLGAGLKLPEPAKQTRAGSGPELKQANEALSRLNAAKRKKQALIVDEERLPGLTQQVNAAKQASDNLRALESLLEHKIVAQNVSRLEGEIDDLRELHPGIDLQNSHLAGEFASRVDKLELSKQACVKLERAVLESGGASAPVRIPLESDEFRLKQAYESAAAERAMLENLGQREALAKREVERAAALVYRLSPNADLETLAEPDRELYSQIGTIAAKADEERRRQREQEAYGAALANWTNADVWTKKDLVDAERKLLDWLKWTPAADVSRPWLLVLILALCSVAFGFIPELIFRVPLVVIAGAICVAMCFKPKGVLASSRPEVVGLPTEFSLTDPTPDQVAERLAAIAEQKGRLEVRSTLEILFNSIEPPTGEVERLINEIGIECENAYALAALARTIENLLDARKTLHAVQDEIELREGVFASHLSQLAAIFQEFGFICEQGHELYGVGDFRRWIEMHNRRKSADLALEDSIRELADFLDHQGVSADHEIQDRVPIFQARLMPASDLAALKFELHDAKVKLAGVNLDWPRLRNCLKLYEERSPDEIEPSEVQIQIEIQKSLAAELESLVRQQEELRVTIGQAEKEHSVGLAEAEYRRALVQVERRWEEASRDSVRFRILTEIREKLTKEDFPPLVKHANASLDLFSVGRYQLILGEQKDEQLANLTVFDRSGGLKQQFRELSTGTKVHCLLALKLALISVQEESASAGNLKFPLIADEPMAVSDPESGEAIAQALIQISQERQVVVFTSQWSDVSLFQKFLPELPVRTLGAKTLEFPPAPAVRLPRTDLAPIGIHFDPRHPIGAQAVGAIFGVDTPHYSRRLDHLPPEASLGKTVRRLQELKTELDRLHPRLRWEDCEGQKWASTSFSSGLQKLLDDFRGCPHRFLAAIEASRSASFRINHIQEATLWLEEHGYLTPPPALEHLEGLLESALADRPGPELSHVIRAFAEAYVPDFDPAGWNYLPPTKAASVRRSRPEIQGAGLFEELAT
jgi:hypothetical protein